MALKRIVNTEFWVDDKVVDSFTPEDKLFFLYLLTNPHTTQLGIYHINKKNMSFELGYTIDAINVLLDRFENKYKMVLYSNKTNEIAIKNYLKHSIIKGGKPVEDCLKKEIKQVKDKKLLNYVFDNLKNNVDINNTVNNIIENNIINKNENENENENEESYHDSCNDTYHDSCHDTLIQKKYYENLELNNLFMEFLDLRKKLKCKNTDRAITLLLNELNKYDDATKIEIINQSIMNSWKSVYPIKEFKSNKKEDSFNKVLEEVYNGTIQFK